MKQAPAAVAAAVLALAGGVLAGCETVRPHQAVAPPPAPTQVITANPVVLTPPPPAGEAAASCVPKALAAAPRYPDSDAALKAAAGAADRYQLMAAGRLLRQKRLEELERVVSGCR